ncbi:hypothetical protein RB620_25575 [Paenibacillus sp. LHD-117]|uniref:hypothetical protein n=1 Tax=Paenibacillus sp. LHD-117 TaxID=3071412 RepID=UPI0027E16AF8|nr:hypothetical protein [Paenibacillus sp. LHD-117]MDQ6422802.1 hypothetical protein [Paenibacillus sp. LHD-117]
MMIRKISCALAAAVILSSAYGLTSSAAAERVSGATMASVSAEGPLLSQKVEGEGGHHRGEMSRTEFEAYRLEKLREMAAYFGLETDGKSADQLKQELKEARKTNPERWEAFKAEHHAKRLERLQQIAKEQGIAIEGKSAEQLHKELKSAHGEQWPGRSKKDTRQEPAPPPTVAPAPSPAPSVAPTAAPTPMPKPDKKPDEKGAESEGKGNVGGAQEKGNVGGAQDKGNVGGAQEKGNVGGAQEKGNVGGVQEGKQDK